MRTDLKHARDVLRTLPPGTWIICLSGGCDSRVLLDLCLTHAQRTPSLELITVHVHHGLRRGAHQDAEFCAQITSDMHVLHHTVYLDIPHNTGIQAQARRQRWGAILELASQHHATAILIGHHLDDAIETYLMHAARGTGAQGLSSLARQSAPAAFAPHGWSTRCHRPLHHTPRHAIESYARARSLKWVEDPTNQTDDYERNRLRHHVLPHVAPSHHKGWTHTLEILASEADTLNHYANTTWHDHVTLHSPWPGALTLPRDVLAKLPDAVLTRLCIRAYSAVHWKGSLGPAHLHQIKALIRSSTRTARHGLPGARVELEPERIVWCAAPDKGSTGWMDRPVQPVQLFGSHTHDNARGEISWLEHKLSWTMHESEPAEIRDGTLLWRVDTQVCTRLSVRGYEPGDTLTQHALSGGVRVRPIKELLRELKVPAWRRHLWPLLIWDDGVQPARTLTCAQDSRRGEIPPLKGEPSRWLQIAWRVRDDFWR